MPEAVQYRPPGFLWLRDRTHVWLDNRTDAPMLCAQLLEQGRREGRRQRSRIGEFFGGAIQWPPLRAYQRILRPELYCSPLRKRESFVAKPGKFPPGTRLSSSYLLKSTIELIGRLLATRGESIVQRLYCCREGEKYVT